MKVKELIKYLETLDLNREIGIDDADTDWYLRIDWILESEDGKYAIGGNYRSNSYMRSYTVLYDFETKKELENGI